MKNLTTLVLLGWAAGAIADPGPLGIDKSKKGRASDKAIKAVHLEIAKISERKKPHVGLSGCDGISPTN